MRTIYSWPPLGYTFTRVTRTTIDRRDDTGRIIYYETTHLFQLVPDETTSLVDRASIVEL